MNWIVVNIGCIECGVSTAIVGRFSDKAAAEAIAERLKASHYWREGGQNHFKVFEEPALDQIAAGYESTGEERPK